MADDGGDRGRILWVDDEIDLLKPHILFLRDQEYDVTPVSSGEDALREIGEHSYQLVLLDEMMDGMDGLTTLEGIRKVNPALPGIMITKNEEEWLMNEAIAAEISGYLTKPVNPSQIFMACKSVLEKARIQSDKAASKYLEMFQELSARVEQAGELSQWVEIFQELTDWAVEFDKHRDLGLDQLLHEQNVTANQRFSQLVTSHYREWLSLSKDRGRAPIAPRRSCCTSYQAVRVLSLPTEARILPAVCLVIDGSPGCFVMRVAWNLRM